MRFTLFCVLASLFFTSAARAHDWIYSFDTRVEMIDLEEGHEKKINEALKLIHIIVKSVEFMERIVRFSYDGKNEFVQNNVVFMKSFPF